MFTNLIENRGKEFSSILKIGDYLGRTLRQNVELFSVEDGEVTYITESGHVVKGNYQLKPELKLTNIVVEDSSVLEDQKAFEKVVEGKISNLLGNLLEDDYSSAEGDFDKILSMFETKLSFDRIQKRVQEKTERFGEQTKIMESDEFSRVNELKDKLVDHLKENQEILTSGGIKNGVKLALLVSRAFDMPKVAIDSLSEAKSLTVKLGKKSSVYEYLCRKELVQKELLESKSNFDNIWVTNDKVQDLATLVLDGDEDKVREAVATVVTEIPYFSLATKKQLGSLVKNSLSVNGVKVAAKDVSTFVGKIYEMKKPVKKHVLTTLNEKYGIDVRKLDEVPTFRSLLMTEAEILKRVANTLDKKSVLRKSLVELSESLKVKNGAEAIDLAEFLNDVFEEAGYIEAINETSLMSYLDFSRVADDLGKIGHVLKMLAPAMGQDPMAGGDPMAALTGGGAGVTPGEETMPGEDPMAAGMAPQDPLGAPDPMDPDAENPGMEPGVPAQDPQAVADEVMAGEDQADPAKMGGEPDMEGEMEPGMEGDVDPEMEGEEGMEFGDDEFVDEDPEMMGEEPVEQDDMNDKLLQIQDLLSDILGDEGEEDFDFNGDGEFDEDDLEDVDLDGDGEEEGEDEFVDEEDEEDEEE